MKKLICIIVVLALAAALLVGCGRGGGFQPPGSGGGSGDYDAGYSDGYRAGYRAGSNGSDYGRGQLTAKERDRFGQQYSDGHIAGYVEGYNDGIDDSADSGDGDGSSSGSGDGGGSSSGSGDGGGSSSGSGSGSGGSNGSGSGDGGGTRVNLSNMVIYGLDSGDQQKLSLLLDELSKSGATLSLQIWGPICEADAAQIDVFYQDLDALVGYTGAEDLNGKCLPMPVVSACSDPYQDQENYYHANPNTYKMVFVTDEHYLSSLPITSYPATVMLNANGDVVKFYDGNEVDDAFSEIVRLNR